MLPLPNSLGPCSNQCCPKCCAIAEPAGSAPMYTKAHAALHQIDPCCCTLLLTRVYLQSLVHVCLQPSGQPRIHPAKSHTMHPFCLVFAMYGPTLFPSPSPHRNDCGVVGCQTEEHQQGQTLCRAPPADLKAHAAFLLLHLHHHHVIS